MNRRKFMAQTGGLAGLVLSKKTLYAGIGALNSTLTINVSFDATQTRHQIPADFLGLGYEISSLAQVGLLNASNPVYVQLIRTLGATGVIRIGGNTSDYSAFKAEMRPISSPKSTVINTAVIEDLGKFLQAIGWSLIWGLNLGSGTTVEAVAEAQAIAASCGNRLLAFEIGNEPDLFHHEGHRPGTYAYDQFLAEYRTVRDTIRRVLPNAKFAGPDVAGATDWVTTFAQDESRDLALLTHHYYREGQNARSTIEKLLADDPKLKPLLQKLQAASMHSGLPYRLCEMNSFSGGGRPGVSDTLGSALWILDFMHHLAYQGCAGVNVETGVNQLGFISSYSPIGSDAPRNFAAKPMYYGMLAFSQACGARCIPVTYDAGNVNFSAYTVRKENLLLLTLINKEFNTSIVAKISSGLRARQGTLMRVEGPSLSSQAGVTFGGSSVSADGGWQATHTRSFPVTNGDAEVEVPAGSAAVIQLKL